MIYLSFLGYQSDKMFGITVWAMALLLLIRCSNSLTPQSVWVEGRLKCGSQDAGNLRVELVDVDSSYHFFHIYSNFLQT